MLFLELSSAPMDLSLQKLNQAVSIRQQITALERRLAGLFGSSGAVGASTVSSPGARRGRKTGRRPMSAATRAKLATAAKARWAKRKGSAAGASTTTKAPGRKKGGLSAAGRKKLSDAMKARWAARRKAAGGKK